MTSTASLLADKDEPGNAFTEAQLDIMLSLAKLIVLLDGADADLRKIHPSAKSFFGVEDDPVNEQFSKFVRAAMALERMEFTLPQKRELGWLFYERLPETMKALRSMKRHEYDMFAAAAIENLNTHLNALTRGETLMIATDEKPPLARAQAAATKPTINLVPGTRFPLYDSGNPEITAALEKLGAAWSMANSSELSTEDRYVINAVVDTYLPESWGMVQKLVGHPKPVSDRAEQMFLQQLTLLQEQVDAVVERSTQSAFSAIQAYTLFLQNKAAGGKDGLKL